MDQFGYPSIYLMWEWFMFDNNNFYHFRSDLLQSSTFPTKRWKTGSRYKAAPAVHTGTDAMENRQETNS